MGTTNDGIRKRTNQKDGPTTSRGGISSSNRTSINVLLLGDEGVGKSTLISTFVSRHFSEVVPGIMTRVRLPPNPSLLSCITTIVDSQGADAALLSAIQQQQQQSLRRSYEDMGSMSSLVGVGGGDPQRQQPLSSGMGSSISTSVIESVDSIILVYDLDRLETFYRLENHWLPLIQRCYNGEIPVVIAGNKMDLFRQSSSTTTTSPSSNTTTTNQQQQQQTQAQRSRQQIVSLLQKFKFVRQCIKCSAKNLLNVDEVFLKAQQSVLYPISPLYDLNTGNITTKCTKAFTRIFRMYDVDNDGLLSNAELNAFQNRAFHVPLVERDVSGWKKVVSKHNPSEERVIQDGKFTVCGFLAIFDVFISQNRLEVPWRILRTFGYDDDLNLEIPHSVLFPPWLSSSSTTTTTTDNQKEYYQGTMSSSSNKEDWKLSPSAINFLTAMFHQFDSNGDGILSSQDILNIFSVIPEPYSLPPWHSLRAPNIFRSCFSIPKVDVGDMVSTNAIAATTTTAGMESTVVSSSLVGSSSSPSPPPLSSLPQQTAPTATSTTKPPSPPLDASGITICSAASSVEFSAAPTTTTITPGIMGRAGGGEGFQPKPRPLSFFDWIGQWHMISAVAPSTTRAELYRLGHIEDTKQNAVDRHRNNKRGTVAVGGGGGKNKRKVSPAITDYSSILLPSKEIRTLVMGSQGCGKTALLNYLCMSSKTGVEEGGGVTTAKPDPLKTTITLYPETSSSYVRMEKHTVTKAKGGGDGGHANKSSTDEHDKDNDDGEGGEEFIVHLVFTEVPANDALQQGQFSSQEQFRSDLASMINGGNSVGGGNIGSNIGNKGLFDLIILVFDCTDPLSFTFVKEMESTLLTEDTPRVFIGSKLDKMDKGENKEQEIDEVEEEEEEEGEEIVAAGDVEEGEGDGGEHGRSSIEIANEHCEKLDLEPPLLMTSSLNDALYSENYGGKEGNNITTARHNVLEHFARCTFDINDEDRLRSTPHAEQKRREAAKRKKMLWLGGIFSVSVAVAIGVSVFWGGGGGGKKGSGGRKDRFTWLRSFFTSGKAVAAE